MNRYMRSIFLYIGLFFCRTNCKKVRHSRYKVDTYTRHVTCYYDSVPKLGHEFDYLL